MPHGVRKRFGPLALQQQEQQQLKSCMESHLFPLTVRLLHMIAVRLSSKSFRHFREQPLGFHFVAEDLGHVSARCAANALVCMCAYMCLAGTNAAPLSSPCNQGEAHGHH